MCKNANATVADLLAAIEPTLINLLTVLNVASTPEGQAAINAYNVALQAVQNWKPGTSAQDVIQVIEAFTAAFNAVVSALPVVPPVVQTLVNIISAGIVVVIGVLAGNSPAPAGAEEVSALDRMAETEAKVKVLVPGWKESVWDKARAALGDHTVAAKEYKNQWNKGVKAAAKADPKYAVLAAA